MPRLPDSGARVQSLAGVLAVWLLLGHGAMAVAQSVTTEADRYIRVEWTLDQMKRPPWALCGSVYNDYHIPARHVELLIESPGTSGGPKSSRVFHAVNDVPAGSRAIFCLPVPAGATAYEVTVQAVVWGFHEAP